MIALVATILTGKGRMQTSIECLLTRYLKITFKKNHKTKSTSRVQNRNENWQKGVSVTRQVPLTKAMCVVGVQGSTSALTLIDSFFKGSPFSPFSTRVIGRSSSSDAPPIIVGSPAIKTSLKVHELSGLR